MAERVCLVCGLLDSEGGCDHRDDCKREAEVVDLATAAERVARIVREGSDG